MGSFPSVSYKQTCLGPRTYEYIEKLIPCHWLLKVYIWSSKPKSFYFILSNQINLLDNIHPLVSSLEPIPILEEYAGVLFICYFICITVVIYNAFVGRDISSYWFLWIMDGDPLKHQGRVVLASQIGEMGLIYIWGHILCIVDHGCLILLTDVIQGFWCLIYQEDLHSYSWSQHDLKLLVGYIYGYMDDPWLFKTLFY